MPTSAKNLFRFCASCVSTLLCWAVWIVLGITLATLLYIGLAEELPVPDFLLRRAEARMAASGFELKFGRARFDPTGKVLLENVELRSRQFEDPLLTCRLLYVRHNFWSLLSGWTLPSEIHIEGAALQLPAMLSPSGTTEPVVRDLAAVLRHDDNGWYVAQCDGRLGNLALSVEGPAPTFARGRPAQPQPLEELSQRFLRSARQLVPVLYRLEAFETPALAIRLESKRAEVFFTSGGARRPWDQPVVTGPIAASAVIPLDPGAHSVPVHVATSRIAYGDTLQAAQLRAVVRAEFQVEKFSAKADEILLALGAVHYADETADAPLLTADLSAWPTVRTRLATRLDGEVVAAEVEAQLQERSARLHAEGRASADLIKRVLAKHTPRAAPYFIFGDPVAFQADAVLAPGWKFARLASRVDAGRLDSRGVQITAARGRIDINGTDFLAHDARVVMGDNFARGSYWMDFASTDYRMLLEGQLRPPAINGWFRGDWWLAFWNRYFAFPVAPPTADVDIQGRWKEAWRSNNFVHARARAATVWGGDFDTIEATVFVRPSFAHGWELHGTRAGGAERLDGSFQRAGVPNSRDTARFEFDFSGNPAPAVIARMLEGRADEVLGTLAFTEAPQVHAWGAIDRGQAAYQFTGETAKPLHYFGFPLDGVKVRGSVAGADVRLDVIEFATAGGQGKARASLTGSAGERRLGFDAYVNNALLGRAVHAVEEYQANRQKQPYTPGRDSKFVRQAANSQLDVSLSAQGNPADLATFVGSGNASLRGAQLGEVHLFGLLSQVLSAVSLSFSSLKFDSARTSFEMSNGRLQFSDLKVTGPSATIDARGRYSFVSNELDLNAKFKPYDQPGSLLAAAVSLVVNPLTSILDLKLSGPLGDPKWSIDIGAPSTTPKTPDKPAATKQ